MGVAKTSYDWSISKDGGLTTGAYIVYRALEAITLTKIGIGLADSGFGGVSATIFELYVLPANSLPASPPSGLGVENLTIPAVGAGVMNAAIKTISVSLDVDQILVIGISSTPDVYPNYAQISLRANT
jgi:hypothetical protein